MAIDHKFSNTSAKSLLEVLQSNARFIVPMFQRNYSWNKEKVASLWSDILDNYYSIVNDSSNEKDAQYLLGPIVLVNTEEKGSYYIIDGQQRLSTITMIFCVARDIILEDLNGDHKPDGFDKINELVENSHMGRHTSWKLELNDTDKEFFREIQEFEHKSTTQLDRIKKLKPSVSSLKNLQQNYIFLHDAITQKLYTGFEDKKPDVEKLDESAKRQFRINNHPALLYFLTHIRENNYVVQIVVGDDGSAFQIFETLNERGQTLSKSNLIKNHILNKIPDKALQTEQSNKWNRIFDDIISGNQPDDDFIIESYHSRLEEPDSLRTLQKEKIQQVEMTKKNLYKIVKKIIENEHHCKKFIKELDQDSAFLSTLNDPAGYFDEKSKDDVYSIKLLRAKFIRIPILAAYRKWSDDHSDDYSNLVHVLVKFFFKIRVVHEEHPGNIDKIIREITATINQAGSFDDVYKMIQKHDKKYDFKYDFTNRFVSEPSKDVAKYVLYQITRSFGPPYDDVRPIDNLTLEHILPMKPNESWNTEEFLEGREGNIDEYKVRLGNMTLLHNAINSKLQNESFQMKRDRKDKHGNDIGYRSSSLAINKNTIINYDSWTVSVIEKREKIFAERAVQIWEL